MCDSLCQRQIWGRQMGKPHPMALRKRVVGFVDEGNSHRDARQPARDIDRIAPGEQRTAHRRSDRDKNDYCDDGPDQTKSDPAHHGEPNSSDWLKAEVRLQADCVEKLRFRA